VQSTLSREQIEEAIAGLSTASWVRLRKIAAAYGRTCPLGGDDLLQEAFARALDGSRNCPVDVDVVRFLAETMRSIAFDSVKALSRHPELQAVSLIGDDGLSHDPADEAADAEHILASEQEVARIKGAILSLFDDDVVAQIVVEGMMEGMEGEELRATTELSTTGFASKRRLIRRRIDDAYPDGWLT